MSVNCEIKDGNGNKYKAQVTKERELLIVQSPYPPLEIQKTQPFRQYLTTDGTTSGSNDMSVDGSSTNVPFYVKADNDSDRYISALSIIVGYAASGKPYQWADTTALTNGIRLYYESFRGETDIDDAIKTNAEFLRLANDNVILSDWEVRHIGALNDYGYFIKINLSEISPMYGVKLDKGSNQRLIMDIRDDVTAATTFNVQVLGFDRFE